MVDQSDNDDIFRWRPAPEEDALFTRLGIANAEHMAGWNKPHTGPSVMGLIIGQPNFGELTFTARFPYCEERMRLSIGEHLIIDERRLGETGVSASFLYVKGSVHDHDPFKFAAAIDRILLPGKQVKWHYSERPLLGGVQRNLHFDWQLADSYDAAAPAEHSSLPLTPKQRHSFMEGSVVQIDTDREMRMRVVRVHCGDWSRLAFICSHSAFTNGAFRYMVAATLR